MLSGSKFISKGRSRCERCPKASPGVLLPSAAPAIERDHFISADAGFANWTHLSVRSGLQPLQTGEKNARMVFKPTTEQSQTAKQHGSGASNWKH